MAKLTKWDLWDGQGADGYDYCESLFQLSQYYQPALGLEIGVRFGKSALATMMGSPKMKLIGIDPNPEYPVEEFMNVRVGSRFTFINEPSPHALERYTNTELFDWIYLDGRHDFQGVLEDFRAAWPLLKPGGIMVFDDYDATLGYGTEVAEVLKQHTEEITGKPFMYITMEDYGLHPSPHKDAILVK